MKETEVHETGCLVVVGRCNDARMFTLCPPQTLAQVPARFLLEDSFGVRMRCRSSLSR